MFNKSKPSDKNWKQQVIESGVSPHIIALCSVEQYDDNYIQYPCEYPPQILGGQILYPRIYQKRALSESMKANPKLIRFLNPKDDELPDGKLPLFYTPNYQLLQKAIAEAGGALHLFEGAKDVQTAMSAGLLNAAGIFSASERFVDEDAYKLLFQLKDLGVKYIRFYPDLDHAGIAFAQSFFDMCQKTGIQMTVLALHYYVNDKRIKDTTDIWLAVSKDSGKYLDVLNGLNPLGFITFEEKREMQQRKYKTEYYDDVESAHGFRYKRASDVWSMPQACPFETHDNDDNQPAFGYNREWKSGHCFKCEKSYSVHALAKLKDINRATYLSDNQPQGGSGSYGTDWSADSPANAISNIAFETATSMRLAGSLLKGFKGLTDYSMSPASDFMVSLDDALDAAELRLTGAQISEFPPIENPIKAFHYLTGAAETLKPPIMVGLLGLSGGFKCVTENTRIVTEQGYLPIKHFATGVPEFSTLGIKVLTPDGEQVASHFYDSGIAPTKRVTTRFGYDVQGTHRHPILVLNSEGCLEWKRLDEVQAGDYAAIHRKTSMFGSNITLPASKIDKHTNQKTVSLPETLDTETAYIFGLLIGDGGLTQLNTINFTTIDVSLLEAVKDWTEARGLQVKDRSPQNYRVNSTVLYQWLLSLGIKGYSYEKEIPECIWTAPREQVRAFLQGLFDTDGHAAYKDKFLVSLATSSLELSKGVQQMLLQFGIVSRRQFVKNTKRGDWRITMRGIEAQKFFDNIGFRLERKQSIAQHAPKRFNTNVDVVPYLPAFESVGRDAKKHNDFHWSKGHYKPSYTKLKEVSSRYPELDTLLQYEYFFDRIDTVEDSGEVQCYDISVPATHSFISAGFVSHNTTVLSTIVNQLSANGYHGIVFTPEWTSERNADRLLQQFGGMTMGETAKLERFYYEQLKYGSTTFEPDWERVRATLGLVGEARKRLKGKVIYINQFGANVLEVLSMVQEIARRMRASGTPPSYFIFDYAQLAIKPQGFPDWSISDTISYTKAITLQLGLVTFLSSQVRKEDAGNVDDGDLLTSVSGLGLRDDAFNFFFTLSPMRDRVVLPDGRRIKIVRTAVTKNSDGDLAKTEEDAIELYIDLGRMLMMESPTDLGSWLTEPDPENDTEVV